MSRHVRPTIEKILYGPTYVWTLSTMTSRRDDVDATVNVCTGFTYTYVHAIHTTLFSNNP